MNRIRVLLVEDDKEFYKPMIELIKLNNELIDIIAYCNNGQEALNIIQHIDKHIDFVISDVQMSGMGGLMFINQIKQNYPELLSHIFVVSAYIQYNNSGDMDLKQILMNNGVCLPAMSKPIDYKEIISNILMFGASILNSDEKQLSLEEIQALINTDKFNSLDDNSNNTRSDYIIVDKENAIEMKIKSLLNDKYNIDVENKGFMAKYLYEAILLAYQKKGKMFVMKKIYKMIADKYSLEGHEVTSHGVEVSLQNQIKERIDETYSVKFFINEFIKLL